MHICTSRFLAEPLIYILREFLPSNLLLELDSITFTRTYPSGVKLRYSCNAALDTLSPPGEARGRNFRYQHVLGQLM